jgi:chemotaxis protein histidine kinase CheA
MAETTTDSNEVKILPPDKSLLKKLGNVNLDQIFLDKVVETAQKVITNSSDTLFTEALSGIQQLTQFAKTLRATPNQAAEIKPQITSAAFSIKSSAGMAGYVLVGAIAKSLNLVCEKTGAKEITATNIQIILWHIDSLQKVASLKIKGDGGAAGEALHKELESIEKLFLKDKSDPASKT